MSPAFLMPLSLMRTTPSGNLAEFLGHGKVDGEGGEIAIVQADDFGAGIQGALGFLEGVHFHDGVHLVFFGGLAKTKEGWLVEGGHDQEDGIGTRGHGLHDLDFVEDEILAQDRPGHRAAHGHEVIEFSVKERRVG